MTRRSPADDLPHEGSQASAQVDSSDRATQCLSEDDALHYVQRNADGTLDSAIQQHLDTCSVCRVVVGEAARAIAEGEAEISPASRARGSQPLTLSVGDVIMDRYEIVRFAARGGMGEVYEARDSILKENVALKTLVCTALDDPRAVNRLLAEVRLARQVTHPNVCRILEYGVHRPKKSVNLGDATPFLTMEFLRGETLDQRIAQQGKLEPAYVAKLLPQIVAGLSAIHAAGIVHRDIKPQNIFLLPGPPERLVLTDFGLARGAETTASGQSMTGPLVVGTVDYMAPEQIEGKPPTPSFDLYALGVVIFEMLTGRKPFSGPTPLATAIERFRKSPPRPSDVVPGLAPIWDKIVAGCLAPDPAQRFSRADQILAPEWKAPPLAGARKRLAPRLAATLLAAVAITAIFVRFRTHGHLLGAGALGPGPGAPEGSASARAIGGTGDKPPVACTDEAGLPYVVSDNYNMLYRFDPALVKFTKIGMLKCPTGSGVNAMAVDRSGFIWLNYTEGRIYKANPKTLACEPTPYVPGGKIGFSNALSMQFVPDGPGSAKETLFVSDHTGDAANEMTGKGIARADLATMQLTPVGPFTNNLAGQRCELSATREGHLFGFFEGKPAVLTEIDTRTGATPSPRALPDVATNGAYAFSFWGGYFWLYTTRPAPIHSMVTRYDPKSGETRVVMPAVGFQIVAAGISSCAPLEMPSAIRAVTQISAGDQHTCALFGDGGVRCWGDNSHGQLGYGHKETVGDDERAASAGDVNVGGRVRQIAAGDFHTCALLETGKVRCWGSNSHGQLGYGNTRDIGDDEPPASAGDVDVGGPVRQISLGGSYTCAVLETGKVHCWGRGDGGHLGYGNMKSVGDDEGPASVGSVDVGGPVRQVAAGSHTCVALESGAALCWGGGSTGRLGYANLKNIGKAETPASAGTIKLGGKVRRIVLGHSHTCALLETGKIRCWGAGDLGQLGYAGSENIGDDETPASAGDVNVGGKVSDVVAGGYETCALLEGGRVRCWGLRSGKLSASTGDVNVGAPVRQITVGGAHTCVLLETGKVRCWGDDHHGQLGSGRSKERAEAVTAEPDEDVPLL
jgi:alpha-tubulin suppressor-like RCC1 family protein/tRNA A-37 threonylcarbamoyl transferase component Bud32